MLLKINEDNPNKRKINIAVDLINNGGIIIYPTDTVYAIGCSVRNHNAIKKLAALKQTKINLAKFSIICENISQTAEYTIIDNDTFKLMKKNTPGPFTFILPASNYLRKVFLNRRNSLGVRIPDNNIVLELVEKLKCPIITTSLKDEDEILEYTTDPELIYEKYKKRVDAVIDGGYGKNIASTIIDCTNGEYNIIRQGIGILKE